MVKKLQDVYEELCLCSVFRSVTEKPVFKEFFEYCEVADENIYEKRKAYARFVSVIYKQGGSLMKLVQNEVFQDENVYVKTIARGEKCDAYIEKSARRELNTLSAFAALSGADFALDMGVSEEEIPSFRAMNADVGAVYRKRLKEIGKHGYGMFATNGMFRLSDDKQIEPIASADQISVNSFVGYEEERDKVINNTRAFVEGKPAANALLCGDAGTGKSSTVKAVANFFFDEGIRLIELRKDQLAYLPYVMAKIVDNPLKFIIFIDDLSFNRSDDNFSMLKAALEGSASARAKNAVIYATSNRRHIIKESFGDREGDDVHRNDTMQETLSLSERFGLVVQFSKPNKKLYLDIVHELARRNGLEGNFDILDIQAEAFALRKGNRSARCAQQFIDSLL